jgi:hypothetical protein
VSLIDFWGYFWPQATTAAQAQGNRNNAAGAAAQTNNEPNRSLIPFVSRQVDLSTIPALPPGLHLYMWFHSALLGTENGAAVARVQYYAVSIGTLYMIVISEEDQLTYGESI